MEDDDIVPTDALNSDESCLRSMEKEYILPASYVLEDVPFLMKQRPSVVVTVSRNPSSQKLDAGITIIHGLPSCTPASELTVTVFDVLDEMGVMELKSVLKLPESAPEPRSVILIDLMAPPLPVGVMDNMAIWGTRLREMPFDSASMIQASESYEPSIYCWSVGIFMVAVPPE